MAFIKKRFLLLGFLPLSLTSAPEPSSIELFEAAERVFKNNCYNCHGATKQKGELRLDRESAAMAGGESGSVSIIPKDAEASLVVERMRLHVDDDDVMPPAKKPRIAPEGIEAVAAWIQAGAVWPDASVRAKRSSSFIEIIDEEAEAMMASINATGAKAEYNSWNDTRIRIDLSFTDKDKLEDALDQLETFGDRLMWLDLSGLDIPSEFYQTLTQYPNLERLHLDHTKVSDGDLKNLAGLDQLVYLNLYGTKITDSGIEHIRKLPSLKKVFLGATKVSSKAAKQLAESQAGLVVVHR
ncbi:MAG: c-type cytochrome domain-containing protein [Opitutaceae bacterium]